MNHWRSDWFHVLLATLLPLTLYALTAPLTIALEDDGFFVLNAYYYGVNHPPGYPVWTLLSHLFTYLPFGSIAYRVHLASAFCAALTCGALWYCQHQILQNKWLAHVATLCFAVSTRFWSQAIIAEVYTLNTLLFFTAFAIALRLYQTRDADVGSCRGLFILLAAVAGLGLSNHWPLFVIACPAFLPLLWPQRQLLLGHAPLMILALLLGLSPYLLMTWRSLQLPETSFLGPITSAGELVNYIMRRDYGDADVHLLADERDRWQYVAFSLRELANQFTVVGTVIALWGCYWQAKAGQRAVLYAIAAGIGSTYIALLSQLNFTYDTTYQAVFSVYPLLVYGLFSLWLGLGLQAINERSAWPSLLSAALPLALLLFFLPHNNRSDYRWSQQYAMALLQALPQDAMVITHSDVDVGVIGYYHMIEGIRPDVSLYNSQGLLFRDKFYPPRLPLATRLDILNDVITAHDQPIVFTGYLGGISYPMIDRGLYIFVEKSPGAVGKAVYDSDYWDFVENSLLVPANGKDHWTTNHRNELLWHAGFAYAYTYGNTLENNKLQNALVGGNFYSLAGYLYGMLSTDKTQDLQQLKIQIMRAIEDTPTDATAFYRAKPLAFLGNWYLLNGNEAAAMAAFKQSLKIDPTTRNIARLYLEGY